MYVSYSSRQEIVDTRTHLTFKKRWIFFVRRRSKSILYRRSIPHPYQNRHVLIIIYFQVNKCYLLVVLSWRVVWCMDFCGMVCGARAFQHAPRWWVHWRARIRRENKLWPTLSVGGNHRPIFLKMAAIQIDFNWFILILFYDTLNL